MVSQPFDSWNWKFSTALECGCEGIYLQAVGFGIGDSCSGCFVTLAQAEFDGMVDRQRVVGPQHARFADHLFSRIDRLQAPGFDPKWKSINLAATVPGLPRFAAAQEWLDRRARGARASQ